MRIRRSGEKDSWFGDETLAEVKPANRRSRRARLVRRWWLSLVITMTAAAAAGLIPTQIAAAAGSDGRKGSDLGPGCAPDRPAIAHHAGGVIVNDPESTNETLISCSTPTGWRTGEMGIAVTNAGTVLLAPAFPEAGLPIGVLRSSDQGASWQDVVPPNFPPRLDIADENLGIDRGTGRAFWITPGYFDPILTGECNCVETAGVWYSDDDGRTWNTGGEPVMIPPSGHADSMKIFAGPPTQPHEKSNYPDVVYNCGGHKPQRCQTSHDGGLTWEPPSELPFPPELAPIQGRLNDCSNFGLNGVVGRDGTVYFGYTPCNRPYVAISHDEGHSWQPVQVADVETIGWGMAAVGIDGQGNLYTSWVAAADRLPYLAVSRDGGQSWSKPMMVGAPGVNEAALPRLVAGKRGQVAVAYYGSKNSPGAPFPPNCTGLPNSCPAYENETWDTYITETFNALSKQPLFWSAAVNDPAHPTMYGCTPSSLGVIRLDESIPFQFGPGFTLGCQGQADFFGMYMAPDDTPWIGFPQMCPGGLPVPGNPNCPSTLTGAPGGMYFSMVGRLVRVGGEGEDEDD